MAENEILHGLHAVQAALEHEPERVTTVWIEQGRHDRRMRELEAQARAAGARVRRVPREALERKAPGRRHQGVVAEVQALPPRDESELLPLIAALDAPPFLLVLDGVQDPHNLGACLRTADAAGVHAVIAPKDRACGLTGTVRKVASGAAETVPFFAVTNLARTLRALQDAGVWLVGTDVDADTELFAADLTGPLALILGAEGRGLRRLTREACDTLIALPMRGTVQSLNVSVAAGICLYEALRQRGFEKQDCK